MTLSPGTRLGPYEILFPLGAGGMGEVYKARDTTLDRDVAIKILPDAFVADPERVARFQREAKTLASLNHPNIGGIYGLEERGGVTALVMELVQGEDLSQRIARGPIPIDEALPIAQQIAEALVGAHEQGVIHRDLKPANIKVRPDGTVKVLDFGLAKAMEPVGTSPNVSQSPTITTPAMMTGVGIILGTAAYMSPEQAKGRAADKRSDVWAFGCVVYEMLTGKRAFEGEDVSDTLAAVLRGEPDWNALPSDIQPAMRTLVQRCLVKDPARRIADISIAQYVLTESASFANALAPTSVLTPPRPLWRRALPLMAALAVGALITQGAAMWRQPRVARDAESRFALDLVPSAPNRGLVAVSPDGQRLAVITGAGLSVRERNVLEPRLVHKGAVASTFFSPDGQSIGFYEDGQLKRIESKGGTPVVIARVTSVLFGGGWSHDDTILFGQPQGIMRVSASGGTPELVIAAKPGEFVYGAQLLPDARTVLYSVAAHADWSDARVVAQRIGAGDRVVLVNGGYDARYVPTGHLVYGSEGQLFAIAFDAERLAVRGRAESVVQGLQPNRSGSASYGVSDDGVLAYVGAAGHEAALRTIVWVDRQGREVPVGAPEREYGQITVSPDGSQLALWVARELWVYSLSHGVMDRLTSISVGASIWSPSGKDLIYYGAPVEGGGGLFRQSANGSGPVERLATGNYIPLSWSRDGRFVLYLDFAANLPGSAPPDADLGLLTLDGARAARPLIKTPAREDNADLSPDGRWIAFESYELGGSEVFVRPFPDVDAGRWRISTAGGFDPVWARDGHVLYFREGRAIMEVSVTGTNPSAWGRPIRLFESDYIFSGGPRTFDIAPDGRFAMLKRVSGGDTSQPGVIVVLNWQDELKRLVQTK